jgi:hypothetical protein
LFSQESAPGQKALMDEVIRLSPGTVDLTGALDGVTEPVFYDWAHTNELGARLVGEAMYARLRPALRSIG